MKDYQFIVTKDPRWIKMWDEKVAGSEIGHYLQLSEWIKSYVSYGFDYSMILLTSGEEIVGGASVVLMDKLSFRIATIPYGPLLFGDQNSELYDEMITFIVNHTKRIGVCYLQMNIPEIEEDEAPYQLRGSFPILNQEGPYYEGQIGNRFKQVSSVSQMGYVDLNPISHGGYDGVIKGYRSIAKDNLKRMREKNLQFACAESDDEMKKVYGIIQDNGLRYGYAVRSWGAIGPSLKVMKASGYCKMPYCTYNDKLVGGAIILRSGLQWAYVMGGTLKSEKCVFPGYYLHDQIIRASIVEGLPYYDISVGGNAGVEKFKESFGRCKIILKPPRHWLHKPMKFWLFEKIVEKMKGKKKFVEKLLLLTSIKSRNNVSDTKSTPRILSLFSNWLESGRRVLHRLNFEYPLRGHRRGNRKD